MVLSMVQMRSADVDFFWRFVISSAVAAAASGTVLLGILLVHTGLFWLQLASLQVMPSVPVLDALFDNLMLVFWVCLLSVWTTLFVMFRTEA